MKWGSAQHGNSGLWFKAGTDDQGRKQLLVAELRSGVDGGSHDHYWERSAGGSDGYCVQLRDRSGSASISDRKGHIYARDTSFPGMTDKYLKNLFDHYC